MRYTHTHTQSVFQSRLGTADYAPSRVVQVTTEVYLNGHTPDHHQVKASYFLVNFVVQRSGTQRTQYTSALFNIHLTIGNLQRVPQRKCDL
jgi:hypothetical protein